VRMHRQTRRRVRRVVPGWAGLALLLTLAAVLTLPELFGYHLLAVQTDSMNPTIHAGDLVIGRPPAGQRIDAGTVITFHNSTGQLVTHRVIRVEGSGSELAYYTQGDASDLADDHPVGHGEIVALYSLRVPHAGLLVAFARSWFGLVVLVILPGTILIVSEAKHLWLLLRQASVAQHRQRGA
jgi:signal peptidase